MAYITRAELKAQMEKRADSVIRFLNIEDMETATIRLAIDNLDDLRFYTYHHEDPDNWKSQKVVCLRSGDNWDGCPMCNANMDKKFRCYIPVINYTTDEEGNLKAEPMILDKSGKFIDDFLDPIEKENGDLNIVLRYSRRGTGLSTTYSCITANTKVYPIENYPISDEDRQKLAEWDPMGWLIKEKTVEEMQEAADKYVASKILQKPEVAEEY